MTSVAPSTPAACDDCATPQASPTTTATTTTHAVPADWARVLMKMRADTMFELRFISHQRPVSDEVRGMLASHLAAKSDQRLQRRSPWPSAAEGAAAAADDTAADDDGSGMPPTGSAGTVTAASSSDGSDDEDGGFLVVAPALDSASPATSRSSSPSLSSSLGGQIREGGGLDSDCHSDWDSDSDWSDGPEDGDSTDSSSGGLGAAAELLHTLRRRRLEQQGSAAAVGTGAGDSDSEAAAEAARRRAQTRAEMGAVRHQQRVSQALHGLFRQQLEHVYAAGDPVDQRPRAGNATAAVRSHGSSGASSAQAASATSPRQQPSAALAAELDALASHNAVSRLLSSPDARRRMERIFETPTGAEVPQNSSPVSSEPTRPRLFSRLQAMFRPRSQHRAEAASATTVPAMPNVAPVRTETQQPVAEPVRAAIPARFERLIEPTIPRRRPAGNPNPTPFDTTRETVENELRTLLGEGLVSQILNGDFRPVLELHFRDRHGLAGHSGSGAARRPRVPRAQLPQRAPAVAVAAPLPRAAPRTVRPTTPHAAPMASAAAPAAMPQAVASVFETRLSELTTTVNELTRIVRMSYDLQLDVQRSIHQEVAAAMQRLDLPAAPVAPSEPAAKGACLICLEATADSVLYRCGHLCACNVCARDLRDRGHRCPVCRANIDDIMRVYVP